jgi:hypothetical protein
VSATAHVRIDRLVDPSEFGADFFDVGVGARHWSFLGLDSDFQSNNVLQRDSVEGARAYLSNNTPSPPPDFQRNQPFQAYRFFRKTERAFVISFTYTPPQ